MAQMNSIGIIVAVVILGGSLGAVVGMLLPRR